MRRRILAIPLLYYQTLTDLSVSTHIFALASSSSSSGDSQFIGTKNKKCKIYHASDIQEGILISSGLNNLGNTCYLNAQLQCSFHIPYVRNLILDTNHDKNNDKDDGNSMIGVKALQNVFSSMVMSSSKSQNPVPTSSTRLFCQQLGINVFEQQDSQEFWKLLLPMLNLPKLLDVYQGAFEDYIVAQDGSGRERRKEELFLDISLEVGSGSVFNSIKEAFTKPELLSKAEGNGWRPEKGAEKVDALKGSLLRAQGLPSILQLHLKRFHYDWSTDQMSKINDSFLFPEELDLSLVCADITDDETSNAVYDLQSIVVHKGEYGSGHYYSYVRPDVSSSEWYLFDDHRVTKVDYYDDVIVDCFGDKMQTKQTDGKIIEKKGFWSRLFGNSKNSNNTYGYGGKHSSAYMLQYVRRSDIPILYK